jgi:hypothetical protein
VCTREDESHELQFATNHSVRIKSYFIRQLILKRLYPDKSVKPKVSQSFEFSHINRKEEKSENARRQAVCHHYRTCGAICRENLTDQLLPEWLQILYPDRGQFL